MTVPAMDDPVMAGEQLTHVEGKAGDLLIWHSFLPHGSCRNDSSRPRMMQLITMFPCVAFLKVNCLTDRSQRAFALALRADMTPTRHSRQATLEKLQLRWKMNESGVSQCGASDCTLRHSIAPGTRNMIGITQLASAERDN